LVNEPRDHSARRRFAEELDRNFSVVASAGSGKTQAITERVVQLAKSEKALAILPKLVASPGYPVSPGNMRPAGASGYTVL